MDHQSELEEVKQIQQSNKVINLLVDDSTLMHGQIKEMISNAQKE